MADTTSASSEAIPTIDSQPLHPAQHWEQLANENHQEETHHDSDSALDSGVTSETSVSSITSSILQYRTFYGRTFHSSRGNAEYWLSNDEQQNESMDIVHHFLTLTIDGEFCLAPVGADTQTVLDVGTGTGTWAIDFADRWPQAKIVGTDISPIQPSWVPPNLNFEIEDFNDTWTFEADSFDLIHSRYLHGSVKDWSAFFKECYRACRPGGWMQSYEGSAMFESDDGTVSKDSAMHEWGKLFIEGVKKNGQTFLILENDLQRKGMEEAGFVDITVVNKKVPVGGWPKDKRLREIGQFVLAALEQDFEGYVLYMASQLLGWKMEEVTVYCALLRRELRSTAHHPFFRVRIVYGHKPIH